jgi:hypothetical protein
MALFIQIQDGQPVNHPVYDFNLIQVYGTIPQAWAMFERTECPTPSVYQILDSQEPTYQLVNNVWTDVWSLRDMTDAEKLAKQQKVQANWASMPNASNFTAWVFDETTCSFEPPTTRPTDGKPYFWQGTTNSWVLIPPYPDDGKQYKLDIPTATWVEST